MSKTLIMIPVYNAEEFIERTLLSAVNQTLKTEVWVVDNCSTDNTQKIIKAYQQKYKNLKLFVNKKNCGRIGNWNKCLDLFEKSEYKYLKWLFSGDELFPNCVKEVEKAFKVDSEIAAVAFPYEFRDLSGQTNVVQDYKENHLFGKKKMKLINLEDGGLLSAIICNAYNKKFINGYRFLESFITKNDFDFKIFMDAKGYYLDKVLARFNLDSRKTFFKAMNYITETEFVFNRAYWLEKLKSSFTDEEYRRIRDKIYIEFVTRNMDYYPLSTIIRMLVAVVKRLPKIFLVRMAEFKNRLLKYV